MKLLLLLTIGFLNGCSTATINSNADIYVKNKIENTIRKSAVDRHTNYEAWKLGASHIGYVETSYCQIDFRDVNPGIEALISE